MPRAIATLFPSGFKALTKPSHGRIHSAQGPAGPSSSSGSYSSSATPPLEDGWSKGVAALLCVEPPLLEGPLCVEPALLQDRWSKGDAALGDRPPVSVPPVAASAIAVGIVAIPVADLGVINATTASTEWHSLKSKQ